MDPFKAYEMACYARSDAYNALLAESGKSKPDAETLDRLMGELEAADERKTEAEQDWHNARNPR